MVGLGSGPASKVKTPPTKGKPRVVSATKVTQVLDILQDIVSEMRLPVVQHERLMRRIGDVRDGS